MSVDFDQLWDYGKPEATAEKFRALLPASSESLEYRLQLQTQLARTQSLQRKFTEAHAILDEIQPLLSDKTPVTEIRYNLERGRTFNSAGEKDKAKTHFTKAFDLVGPDHFTVDAAHMMAIAETAPDKQMEWNLKAMALAEKSENPKARNWLGSLYNNIGWTYHSSQKYNDALDMFQRALAFREKMQRPTEIRIAKWCIARTYRSLENYDEALRMQLAIKEEAGSDASGFVFEELGELYLMKGDLSESKIHFARAYEMLSPNPAAIEAKRLDRIRELSI